MLLTEIPKVTFKDNRAFGVVDPRGEAPRSYASESAFGFYYNDTRYLSTWESTVNGQALTSLAHELISGGNTVAISMTNRDLPVIGDGAAAQGLPTRIPRETFLIRRTLTLWKDRLYEMLAFQNFDSGPHTLQLEQWLGSRFDDIFEVRGFARAKRGRMLPPQELDSPDGARRLSLMQYEGLDGRVRKAFVRRYFDAEKIRVSPGLMGYFTRFEVPAKGTVVLRTLVTFDELTDDRLGDRPFSEVTSISSVPGVDTSSMAPFSPISIRTDHEIVNRSIRNAAIDIHMLLTEEKPHLLYPYAGIPWFSAPFGRDGIITAYQMLPWHPSLARGVLDIVFSTLGTKFDDFTDEQPGKVFHELRRGEMAQTREVPFIPYYGSVDSTPLALILLHEYMSWTMDLEKLRDWWPDALKALEWVDRWGDSDNDGFIEYCKLSPTGLVNQGWKDSHDSIMHADGKLAQAPIRLCEVQAYAFRARMGMSQLARLLGETERAAQIRARALRLRADFMDKFWDNARRYVYLALDADCAPCKVVSSNMGHCLWCQILFREQADNVTSHLMSSQMFSGNGIRTLSSAEVAYNPMSYHDGSIWPHDNSLIMEGFRNYGKIAELDRLCTSMIEVLELSDDFRLPELFCGFEKKPGEPPIPYEVACKPQAWGAGSVFLMLKSMLGLAMEPGQAHLVFRSPILTSKIGWLEITGLHGRDWEIDLRASRAARGTSVTVTRKTGNVRVLTVL